MKLDSWADCFAYSAGAILGLLILDIRPTWGLFAVVFVAGLTLKIISALRAP